MTVPLSVFFLTAIGAFFLGFGTGWHNRDTKGPRR